ncbi:hypothetical protein [Jongsikchunia kroppenstedtii]|uniref:hypothetical protein n=1 Tax=Jongsikchunia kroppenstedtii TaxID=1121721 RepID=UPI0003671350|nr:hypothetical protein [Jongsikchunia kroppenstedtii]
MSDPEAAERLAKRLVALLRMIGTAELADNQAITFTYRERPGTIQVLPLATGLDVIALTLVTAWDRPSTPELRDEVERLGLDLSFGTLKRAQHDGLSDVLLHYTFPASGLKDAALLTLVELVLSAGADAGDALSVGNL